MSFGIKDQFNEGYYVRFEEICPSEPPTARFRSQREEKLIDKDGNARNFYHVKVTDLHKRERKLRRQNIDPTQTNLALDAAFRARIPTVR